MYNFWGCLSPLFRSLFLCQTQNHFYSEGHCMMYCGEYARESDEAAAPVCDMSPYSSKSDCFNRKRLSNYWYD